MGLGGFPGTHELSLGMLGMHGTYAANMAISHADLILALGARFDDRVTGKVDEFAPGAKIIQADIDPTSISKNVRAHLPIVGDVKSVLRDLLPHLRAGQDRLRRPSTSPGSPRCAPGTTEQPALLQAGREGRSSRSTSSRRSGS